MKNGKSLEDVTQTIVDSGLLEVVRDLYIYTAHTIIELSPRPGTNFPCIIYIFLDLSYTHSFYFFITQLFLNIF